MSATVASLSEGRWRKVLIGLSAYVVLTVGLDAIPWYYFFAFYQSSLAHGSWLSPVQVNGEIVRQLTEGLLALTLRCILGTIRLPGLLVASLVSCLVARFLSPEARHFLVSVFFAAGYFWVRTSDHDFFSFQVLSGLWAAGALGGCLWARRTTYRPLVHMWNMDWVLVGFVSVYWSLLYRHPLE